MLDLMEMFATVISMTQRALCVENDEKKILDYLYYLKGDQAPSPDGKIYIKRTKTYETLSRMLFMTREYVSRVLNQLKNESVIDITDEYIIILDAKKIEREIGFFE